MSYIHDHIEWLVQSLRKSGTEPNRVRMSPGHYIKFAFEVDGTVDDAVKDIGSLDIEVSEACPSSHIIVDRQPFSSNDLVIIASTIWPDAVWMVPNTKDIAGVPV